MTRDLRDLTLDELRAEKLHFAAQLATVQRRRQVLRSMRTVVRAVAIAGWTFSGVALALAVALGR